MQGYAAELRTLGFEVTSRWINGSHQAMLDGGPLGAEREALFESGDASMEAQRRAFAQHDWDDLCAADTLISFTERPRTGGSRGGRHVEFGAALALGKRCVVVGWRENVFHCLPQVEFYPDWAAYRTTLGPDLATAEAPCPHPAVFFEGTAVVCAACNATVGTVDPADLADDDPAELA